MGLRIAAMAACAGLALTGAAHAAEDEGPLTIATVALHTLAPITPREHGLFVEYKRAFVRSFLDAGCRAKAGEDISGVLNDASTLYLRNIADAVLSGEAPDRAIEVWRTAEQVIRSLGVHFGKALCEEGLGE